jgi:hypothetical protein
MPHRGAFGFLMLFGGKIESRASANPIFCMNRKSARLGALTMITSNSAPGNCA